MPKQRKSNQGKHWTMDTFTITNKFKDIVPGWWERLPQAFRTTREHCSQLEAVATVRKFSLFMSTHKSDDHVHIKVVEAKRERLLGKNRHSINADCRGHDFDRPRQLPHTGYSHQADTRF